MMDVQLGIVIACIAGGGLAALVVWWMRRPRRVFNIDHVRVELHPAHIVDDRLVDAVWRAAISMTNKSRRPRALPVFGERATVTARRRTYLATVYLEGDAVEINPADVALAWVEFVLPAERVPNLARVTHRCDQRSAREVRIPLAAVPAESTISMPAS